MSSETENYEENEHTTENVEENNEQANDNNGEVTTETPEPKLNSSVMAQRMKERMEDLAEETKRIEEIQQQMEAAMAGSPVTDSKDADARSVYVGNVDYAGTLEELQAHFNSCGTINRVTILCDKFTGKPKGFAYIEFLDESAVENACLLNETLFRGRQIKVTPKRTNVPGLSTTSRRPRRGGRIPRFVRRRRPTSFFPYG